MPPPETRRPGTIATAHIGKMLGAAIELAAQVDGARHPLQGDREDISKLERAANLARHAAAELEDEMLRARDGWPVV